MFHHVILIQTSITRLTLIEALKMKRYVILLYIAFTVIHKEVWENKSVQCRLPRHQGKINGGLNYS